MPEKEKLTEQTEGQKTVSRSRRYRSPQKSHATEKPAATVETQEESKAQGKPGTPPPRRAHKPRNPAAQQGADSQKAAPPRSEDKSLLSMAKQVAQKAVSKTTAAASSSKQGNRRGHKRPVGGSLRIIPLGGLNEIGKNMTVLEFGEDLIIVDCGMTFPDDELLGVDLVIPDITYLQKNRDRVRGIFLTHGHEDHIGALPYVLRDINVPIYCTALTAGIIKLRIAEHRNLKKVRIHVQKAGDHVSLGNFDVEFIHVNHSIADACAFSITTPMGIIVMTGDFKIDTTPVDGEMINLERFGQLGRQGVLMVMCDSTNAERPGMAMSERKVGESFEHQFKGCDKRIIVATFASNVHRIQQIIDVSARNGRKVAVSGRSMDNILKLGTELGYIKPPPNTMIELGEIRKYPKEKLCIITTGSQGEPMSALYRMAYAGHRQVEVGYGDKILIAATPIPGNEKPVYSMINELFRRGAEVVYERLADIHVSGHACQEEIKMILALLKPKYYMPVHGEYRHLMVNASLGKTCGIKPENIFISDLGKVLSIDENGISWGETVTAGRILVDGYGVGDVGNAVLKERNHLGRDGVITCVVGVDLEGGLVLTKPEIVTRGFIFVREAEELMTEMQKITLATLESCFERNMRGRNQIRDMVASRLSDYLHKKTKRDPIIIPVLVEV